MAVPSQNREFRSANKRKRTIRNRKTGRQQSAFAALDLGTNNCRLLVAKPMKDGFRIIDGFSRIVRLGEGVSELGALSDAAPRSRHGRRRRCSRAVGPATIRSRPGGRASSPAALRGRGGDGGSCFCRNAWTPPPSSLLPVPPKQWRRSRRHDTDARNRTAQWWSRPEQLRTAIVAACFVFSSRAAATAPRRSGARPVVVTVGLFHGICSA